jgi:hypothetical protein
MSLTPSSPETWEQALFNGRIVHPSSDEKAAAWAKDWYLKNGGIFYGEEEPQSEPVETPGEEESQEEDEKDSSPEPITEADEGKEEEGAKEIEPPAQTSRRTRSRRSNRQA